MNLNPKPSDNLGSTDEAAQRAALEFWKREVTVQEKYHADIRVPIPVFKQLLAIAERAQNPNTPAKS